MKVRKLILKKKWALVLCFIILSIISFSFFFFSKKDLENVVVLTEKGFAPQKITIKTGEKVTFKNNVKKPFWPASDFHPTHSIYLEFDPKEAIDAGKSWSFVFNRSGEWNYHDHLDPIFVGVITVENRDGAIDSPDCSKKQQNTTEKQQCWESFISKMISNGKLSESIQFIKSAYAQDPEIQPICHSLLHKVGAEAYKNFKKGQPLNLNTDLTLCAFGFFHGFTEAVAKTSGDAKEISDFCTYVTKELSKEIPNIETQCHHGIGHGSVDIDNQAIWGDEEKMTEKSKKLCIATSSNTEELRSCGSGMFDSIAIAYLTDQFELKMNMDDPYWLCKIQKEDALQEACYGSLLRAVSFNVGYDLRKVGEIIEHIPNDDVAGVASSLAEYEVNLISTVGKAEATRIINYYKTNGVSECRSLKQSLVQNCIGSIASSLAYDETKEPKYLDALGFCSQKLLSEKEQGECVRTTFNMLKTRRSVSEYKAICGTLKGTEAEICKRMM